MTDLLEESEALTELLRADGEMVLERLDHYASTTPDRVFFYYGEDDTELTYRRFGELTDHIAGNLAARGIAKGDRVSVFTTNSKVATLAMFGIWKAGAVYAPVNFSFVGRLLAYQLDDTGPGLVITDSDLLPALLAVAADLARVPDVVLAADLPSDVTAPEITIDHWDTLLAPAERPDVIVSFDDPANVVYTSGTTGLSKGVVQPHRWMAGYTYGLRLPLRSDDVIYNDLPMYHVGGAIANVARAAWVGCEVAVWDRFSPSGFWQRIERRGASTAILLDVMTPWLMKAPEAADDRSNSLNKVYMQPLPSHHEEVARRFGFDLVYAGFGQTESGAPLTMFVEECPGGTPPELRRGRDQEEIAARARAVGLPVLPGRDVRQKGLMGRPGPFVDVAVLDEHDRVCPPGQPGQLSVRPKLPGMLFLEYLGKPEATVAAWRNLWFHTGDAAVVDESGLFAFVDRLGDRIRVRGENLSSFQVEDLLSQHDGVQMVAAFAISSGEGDEDDVVAYVTPVEGRTLGEDDLHRFAEQVMPKYMRPKHIRVVGDLPRTPTNKIEKYKLRRDILAQVRPGA